MKLFLASEGAHEETLRRLEKFLNGYSEKSVVFVPTAGNGSGYGQWRRVGGSVYTVKELGWKNFEVLELENFLYQDVSKALNHADVFWFNGGQTGYLLYWMRRTGLDKLLHKFGDEKTYVGSSAGSMACSKTQYMSEIYPGDEEPGAAVIPGLGLIDFEILPHFEEENLGVVKKIWKYDVPLRLLKNGEVITVVSGKVTTLGVERIIAKAS